MDSVDKLKAYAFDIVVTIEGHNREIEKCKQALDVTQRKILEATKAEEEQKVEKAAHKVITKGELKNGGKEKNN
jgi:hypothetical protein